LAIGKSIYEKENEIEAPVLPEPVPGLVKLYREREPSAEQDNFIRLNYTERLRPLPEWFLEKLRRSLQSEMFTTYPIADGLYRQLSAHLGIVRERLLLTAGSDNAIKALYQAYVSPGDPVVTLNPTYAMYQVYAEMFRAEIYKVSFNKNLDLDVDHLLDSIVPGVRLVMIVNPNQPTGTLLSENVFHQLVERTMKVGALLAVDEAYYPFSHFTVLPWIEHAPNLLVIRTFSKAAGLAGLRIGYVAGHEDVIANLYKVRSVHDVNSIAILCAKLILEHPEIISDYVAEVEAGAQLLAKGVKPLGLTPLPNHANFMLIRVSHNCQPSQLVVGLRSRGYLVKGFPNTPCLGDCIRVTLGPPALMAKFADVLRQTLAEFA